jgi:hypothetical protein
MIRPLAAAIISFAVGTLLGAGAVWKIGHSQQVEYSREARRAAMLAEENARLRTGRHGVRTSQSPCGKQEHSRGSRAAGRGDSRTRVQKPVDYNVLSRKQIKETISGKLAEVFSEQEFQHMATALAALGLLPDGFPLRQKYIDLLGEQVAAFYDQHQHKLFM